MTEFRGCALDLGLIGAWFEPGRFGHGWGRGNAEPVDGYSAGGTISKGIAGIRRRTLPRFVPAGVPP